MTESCRITASRLSDKYGGRELLTIKEVETIIGLDRRTIIGHRLVPIRKVGNKLMVSVSDISEFLTRSTGRTYR